MTVDAREPDAVAVTERGLLARAREVVARRPRVVEAVAVVLAAVLLQVLANREQVRNLTTTAPGDLGDPLYFAWQLAWVSHALGTDPSSLWTTPAFLQTPDNLAFTDTVLGYAPLGLVVPGGQAGALALVNLATLTAGIVAIIGGWVLGRAMGAGRAGAAVAAVACGFAPWRLEQIIHINVISSGGAALALGLLARGTGWSLRDGWRPERMDARWIAAGWAVACYQLTFGFATGIWFAWSLAVPMLLWGGGWLVTARRRPDGALPRPIVLAHGLGGLAFLVTAGLLVRPYLRVIAAHPEAQRGENWLPLFSPPWWGLLTAPKTDLFWGERQTAWRASLTWQPEMVLSPGLLLVVLVVTGLFFSVWPWRRRLGLAVTAAVLTVLAMGTAFPGGGEWTYLPLYRHVPGWSALRTPGRLIIWVTFCLALLAAGAVARFVREVRPVGLRSGQDVARGAAAALLAAAPVVGIVGEGLNTTPHWNVSTSPVKLASLPAPIMLLPTDLVGDYHMMLWGTEGWPVLANGNSGFSPTDQVEFRQTMQTFPDAASVAELRRRGVLSVVIVRSRTPGSPWAGAADRPVDGLGITRTDLGDGVVYHLTPTQSTPLPAPVAPSPTP